MSEESTQVQLAEIQRTLRQLADEVEEMRGQIQPLIAFRTFYVEKQQEDIRQIREALRALDAALRGQNGTPGLIYRVALLEEIGTEYKALRKWLTGAVVTGAMALAWSIAQWFLSSQVHP